MRSWDEKLLKPIPQQDFIDQLSTFIVPHKEILLYELSSAHFQIIKTADTEIQNKMRLLSFTNYKSRHPI